MCAQPRLLGSMTDNEKAEVGEARSGELLLHLREQSDVLLDGETPDEAEDEGVVVGFAAAMRRREDLCIYAALHEKTGASGFLFKQFAKSDIGGEKDLCDRVELCAEVERRFLDRAGDCRLAFLAKVAKEPGRASRGVFMNIGVPGGGEREMEMIRQYDADDAVIAGPGNVDDVGAEFLEGADDQRQMAYVTGVEGEVLFEREGDR